MIFEYQTFDTCIATGEQQKLYRRVLTAADSCGRAGIKDRQKNARVRGGIRKMTIYVNAQAGPAGDGSADYPFRTIQEAADIALPGDEVLVAPGVYRENVDPKNAGREDARIVYRSEEPRAAVITGAEIVKGWEPYADENGTVVPNVYKVLVPNSIFGDYNPYTTLVAGDWFIAFFIAHTGEVYLNGKAMYEVTELSKVVKPEIYKASWDPDFTVFTWYTEQDEENDCTVLYANFQGADPNEENRENCFYPQKEHVNYITLSGFTVKQAATQWAPPTAYQEGMIGPHWSRGWIIEDCEVSDSKCSGISLGKYKQPDNDNRWLTYKLKNGTQTERDNIIQSATTSSRRSARAGSRKTSEATSSAAVIFMTAGRPASSGTSAEFSRSLRTTTSTTSTTARIWPAPRSAASRCMRRSTAFSAATIFTTARGVSGSTGRRRERG